MFATEQITTAEQLFGANLQHDWVKSCQPLT